MMLTICSFGQIHYEKISDFLNDCSNTFMKDIYNHIVGVGIQKVFVLIHCIDNMDDSRFFVKKMTIFYKCR